MKMVMEEYAGVILGMIGTLGMLRMIAEIFVAPNSPFALLLTYWGKGGI